MNDAQFHELLSSIRHESGFIGFEIIIAAAIVAIAIFTHGATRK